MDSDNMTFLNGFGVEHILEGIDRIIGKKYMTTKIYIKQVYDSLICGYFYLGFIVFALNNKRLTNFTDLFSPNNFKKDDKMILDKFQ